MTYWMYTPGYTVMLALHAFAPTTGSRPADMITPIALVALSTWSLAHGVDKLLSLATAFLLGTVLCLPPRAIKNSHIARAVHLGKVVIPLAMTVALAMTRPKQYPVAIVFAGAIAVKGIAVDNIR